MSGRELIRRGFGVNVVALARIRGDCIIDCSGWVGTSGYQSRASAADWSVPMSPTVCVRARLHGSPGVGGAQPAVGAGERRPPSRSGPFVAGDLAAECCARSLEGWSPTGSLSGSRGGC